jgi:DNA-binding Xre family transcriptional regulator
MSSTASLITALKAELKARRWTYADLAQAIGMAESSVKRMLSQADMPLSRVDEICKALGIEFVELARHVVNAQPLLNELTLEQEHAVIKDRKLLLVAFCVLSQWTARQMLETYDFDEPELIRCLSALDRLGVIELRPLNRYKLKLARTFRWLPDGPVMNYFRNAVLPDYFGSPFVPEEDLLMLTHGQIGASQLTSFKERLQRVAQDFAQQHAADMKLPEEHRKGCTMILALRQWEFSVFTDMRRKTKPVLKTTRHRL